jgi:hypothetical protein
MERQLGQLEERQTRLAALAESALTEAAAGHLPPEGGASELRMAAGVLASVAGNPQAAYKLLGAHSSRLKRAQQFLLKPQNTGLWQVLRTFSHGVHSILNASNHAGLAGVCTAWTADAGRAGCWQNPCQGQARASSSSVVRMCGATGGSDVDGTEYAGALSQRVFQTVAAAADDMAAVFGDDTPELSSLFVTWTMKVPFLLPLAR